MVGKKNRMSAIAETREVTRAVRVKQGLLNNALVREELMIMAYEDINKGDTIKIETAEIGGVAVTEKRDFMMATKAKDGATKDTKLVCHACKETIMAHWDAYADDYVVFMLSVKGKTYHQKCWENKRLWDHITALEELVEKLNRASGRGKVTGDE